MSRMSIWTALAAVPIAGLLLVTPGVWAGDTDDATETLRGELSIGGHVADVKDWAGRVGEYDLYRETFESDLRFNVFGRSGPDHFEATLDYQNEVDQAASARFRTGPWVDVRFEHRSYHRTLDHDLLDNLQYQEGNATGGRGGKIVTHDDTDPLAVYGMRYTDTKQHLELLLPLPEDGAMTVALTADFRDQRRQGMRQGLSVDHCANCHVRSQSQMVNEQTRDLALGLEGSTSSLRVSYRFSAREYDNSSEAMYNQFMAAQHPMKPVGTAAGEFASRLIYSGSDTGDPNAIYDFARTPDVEKLGHTVKASYDLPRNQSARGSFTFATTESDRWLEGLNGGDPAWTKLELKSQSAALAWYAPLTKKTRVTASFARRKIENDPVAIDLPDWRGGMTGGGQDFDWIRESAYDREEYIGNVRFAWVPMKGHSVRLDYRLHTIDRDNVFLDPDSEETKTTKNRIRASWSGRLVNKIRSRVEVGYEMADLPYVALGGLCESALGDTVQTLPDNGSVYYFQREVNRFGTGSNQPTKALKAKVQVGGSFTPKFYGSAYFNMASEKNDDMNVYDFERTSVNPGASLVFAPTPVAVFSFGGGMSKIKSNAKICATVMDG